MKNKLIATRNHIVRHRFKYGVATGLAAGLYLTHRSGAMYDAFLMEHDLFDKFHAIGMES